MNKWHLPYLDGMRGIAALYVVLHHAFLQSWPTDELQAALHANLLYRPLFFLDFGHFAVTVFIAISGFCLALPVLRKDKKPDTSAGKFFYRRARRILPPYYAAVIFASLLALTIRYGDLTRYSRSLPVTTGDIVTHFLLIHNLNPAHYSKIAGPFWSVAVECQVYLFCPLIFLALRRRGRTVALGICALLAAVSLLFSGLIYHSTPPGIYFVVFGLGVYFADLAVNDPKRWFGKVSFAAALLAFLMLYADIERRGQVMGKVTDVVIGLAAGAFMAYGLVNPRGRVVSMFSNKAVVSLGLFSYSVYLIHFPLLQVIWEHSVFPMKMSPLAGFASIATLGTLVILLISFGFYWIFERPFTSARLKQASAEVFEKTALPNSGKEQTSVAVMLDPQ